MPKLDVKAQVALINARLEQASIPVRVRLNGKVLGLRATLPLKPGKGIGNKQQDIRLGIPTSRDGFKRIEAEAHKLGNLKLTGQFSWELYQKSEAIQMTTGELIAAFKTDYLSGRLKGQKKKRLIQESTWINTWQGTLNKLPQNEPLNETSFLAVVLSLDANSRSRELAGQRLQRFADYAGLELDLSSYAGEYEPEPREIPTDEQIVEWRDRVPNSSWQWVYGMLATFGLRPHEAFNCTFVDALTLQVHAKTKTGSRITRAIQPEWVDLWNLTRVDRPEVTREYGKRTYRQFERYDVPCLPYDLRPAYAIRASVVKRLPLSVSASMMGHSVATHTKVYHRWLSDATNEEVYRQMILRSRDL